MTDPLVTERDKYVQAQRALAARRDSYHRVIREQLAAGRAQKDVVGVTGFTRETIRKISKEGGGDDELHR